MGRRLEVEDGDVPRWEEAGPGVPRDQGRVYIEAGARGVVSAVGEGEAVSPCHRGAGLVLVYPRLLDGEDVVPRSPGVLEEGAHDLVLACECVELKDPCGVARGTHLNLFGAVGRVRWGDYERGVHGVLEAWVRGLRGLLVLKSGGATCPQCRERRDRL